MLTNSQNLNALKKLQTMMTTQKKSSYVVHQLGLFLHCDVVPNHEVDFFVVFGNGNCYDNVHVINQGDKFITFVIITMVGVTCVFSNKLFLVFIMIMMLFTITLVLVLFVIGMFFVITLVLVLFLIL
jgi:hypothetical protein